MCFDKRVKRSIGRWLEGLGIGIISALSLGYFSKLPIEFLPFGLLAVVSLAGGALLIEFSNK